MKRAGIVCFGIVLAVRAMVGSSAPAQSPDAERGKELFLRRCTGCHALDRDMEGPRLGGVYGRKAGTVPGFAYSPALRSVKLVWGDATLERWLTSPDAVVPGNDMDFRVEKPGERADIIRFLRVSSGQ